jgi:starvation-inducible DNA-binding protein
MELHTTKIDLAKGKREKLIAILNQSLADAADLKSQAKQAHWNVKGPNFIALHELFDRVATELDTHVDDLAERITTLGGTAMGTVRLAAENSSLAEYPHEISDGTAHVDALSSALADFAKKMRANIDKTDSLGDMDTADLYTGISRSVDKLLWFVEAHIQA